MTTSYGTSKKGDGLCDGIINNAVCDWDGGDCCPQTTGTIAGYCRFAWNQYCPFPLIDECKCLDPNNVGFGKSCYEFNNYVDKMREGGGQ